MHTSVLCVGIFSVADGFLVFFAKVFAADFLHYEAKPIPGKAQGGHVKREEGGTCSTAR